MKPKLTKELNKELERLEGEIKKSHFENEKYKKIISENLKKINKSSVINSEQKPIKYTLWMRIMRVLGMN
jgi:septal ring factor EnvC (AmiA/AmiB activator)